MFFKFMFFIVVIGGGGYFLLSWALKAWKKADAGQKVEDLKVDTEIYDKIKDVDVKGAKKAKKAVDKFMEE